MSAYKRSSPVQPSSNTDSPRITQQQPQQQRTKPTAKKPSTNNNTSSPILKKSQDDIEVPANVDEVAMINNINEETEHFKSSQESLVKKKLITNLL